MIFWIRILEKARSSAQVERLTLERCMECTECSQVENHTGWVRFWLVDAVVEIHRGSLLVTSFFFLNDEEARSLGQKGGVGEVLKEVRCEKSSMRVESKCTRET